MTRTLAESVTCQRVYLFEGHTNYLCGLPQGHDGPCGAEFDKRAPNAEAELRAEVARLTAELADLRSQANEYGPAPGLQDGADRERLHESLLREVTLIPVDALPSDLRNELYKTQQRIAAALGIGGGK